MGLAATWSFNRCINQGFDAILEDFCHGADGHLYLNRLLGNCYKRYAVNVYFVTVISIAKFLMFYIY